MIGVQLILLEGRRGGQKEREDSHSNLVLIPKQVDYGSCRSDVNIFQNTLDPHTLLKCTLEPFKIPISHLFFIQALNIQFLKK